MQDGGEGVSRWNHSICVHCWAAKFGNRKPLTLREEFRDEMPEICCFCGEPHGSGIYVRENPENVACNGEGHRMKARVKP